MQKIDGKYISAKVTPEQSQMLERLVKKHGKSQSAVLRTILDLGFTAYRDLERIGATRVADLLENYSYETLQAMRTKR